MARAPGERSPGAAKDEGISGKAPRQGSSRPSADTTPRAQGQAGAPPTSCTSRNHGDLVRKDDKDCTAGHAEHTVRGSSWPLDPELKTSPRPPPRAPHAVPSSPAACRGPQPWHGSLPPVTLQTSPPWLPIFTSCLRNCFQGNLTRRIYRDTKKPSAAV